MNHFQAFDLFGFKDAVDHLLKIFLRSLLQQIFSF